MKDLSTGWRWDDNQTVEQGDWNNIVPKNIKNNVGYEPILRKQAVIFQYYPEEKLT